MYSCVIAPWHQGDSSSRTLSGPSAFILQLESWGEGGWHGLKRSSACLARSLKAMNRTFPPLMVEWFQPCVFYTVYRTTCSRSWFLFCGVLTSVDTSFVWTFVLLLVGSLHVGDEILEINGTNVTNHSVDQLQKAMVGIHYALVFMKHQSTLVSVYLIFLWKCLYLIEESLTTANLYSVQEMTALCLHLVNF